MKIHWNKFILITLIVGIVIVAAGWMLLSKSEFDYNHYPSVTDAVQDNAFERGWVPENIPRSIHNIREVHDIDSNKGWGCFELSGEDMSKYKRKHVDEKVDLSDVEAPPSPPDPGWFESKTWHPHARPTSWYRQINDGKDQIFLLYDHENTICWFQKLGT